MDRGSSGGSEGCGVVGLLDVCYVYVFFDINALREHGSQYLG